MCVLCTSDDCPIYMLLHEVTLQGMTYDELLDACRDEEERWKKASAGIVALNKARTRWSDIYTEMFEGDDSTEEKAEAELRAEEVYADTDSEDDGFAAAGGNVQAGKDSGEEADRDDE
ncbi:hypothetical protein BD626DRAFT_575666 [Schizophyllum amplum]|uniref:Uncharacterized protein n=1 Tax=Schizophyllum amplum TaxID=97359 RepID=A0A550BVE5_9AGAR|nr:hypothetical protein BD626DRAFT_575666 [Auriculariopsis ampla]